MLSVGNRVMQTETNVNRAVIYLRATLKRMICISKLCFYSTKKAAHTIRGSLIRQKRCNNKTVGNTTLKVLHQLTVDFKSIYSGLVKCLSVKMDFMVF